MATCSLPAPLNKPKSEALHIMLISRAMLQSEKVPSIECMESSKLVRNEALAQLLTWWIEKRGERSMPSICDIDPAEIRSVLAQVWLCDYLPESGRLRYRLAGEAINDFWGCNLGGKYVDEIVPSERIEAVTQKFRMVVDLPAIVYDRASLALTEEILRTGERLMLPLSDNGKTVNALLGATHRNWFRDLEFDPFTTFSETTTIATLSNDALIH